MISLNLLPEDLRKEFELSKQNARFRHFLFLSLAILIGAGTFFGVLFYYLELQKKDAEIEKSVAQKQIDEQSDSYSKAKDLYTRINLIKKIEKNSSDWESILKEIASLTPQNVQIEHFSSLTKESRAKIVGYALTDKDIVAFKQNLESSKTFSYIDIETITKTKDKLDREVRSFTISLTIKKR